MIEQNLNYRPRLRPQQIIKEDLPEFIIAIKNNNKEFMLPLSFKITGDFTIGKDSRSDLVLNFGPTRLFYFHIVDEILSVMYLGESKFALLNGVGMIRNQTYALNNNDQLIFRGIKFTLNPRIVEELKIPLSKIKTEKKNTFSLLEWPIIFTSQFLMAYYTMKLAPLPEINSPYRNYIQLTGLFLGIYAFSKLIFKESLGSIYYRFTKAVETKYFFNFLLVILAVTFIAIEFLPHREKANISELKLPKEVGEIQTYPFKYNIPELNFSIDTDLSIHEHLEIIPTLNQKFRFSVFTDDNPKPLYIDFEKQIPRAEIIRTYLKYFTFKLENNKSLKELILPIIGPLNPGHKNIKLDKYNFDGPILSLYFSKSKKFQIWLLNKNSRVLVYNVSGNFKHLPFLNDRILKHLNQENHNLKPFDITHFHKNIKFNNQNLKVASLLILNAIPENKLPIYSNK